MLTRQGERMVCGREGRKLRLDSLLRLLLIVQASKERRHPKSHIVLWPTKEFKLEFPPLHQWPLYTQSSLLLGPYHTLINCLQRVVASLGLSLISLFLYLNWVLESHQIVQCWPHVSSLPFQRLTFMSIPRPVRVLTSVDLRLWGKLVQGNPNAMANSREPIHVSLISFTKPALREEPTNPFILKSERKYLEPRNSSVCLNLEHKTVTSAWISATTFLLLIPASANQQSSACPYRLPASDLMWRHDCSSPSKLMGNFTNLTWVSPMKASRLSHSSSLDTVSCF